MTPEVGARVLNRHRHDVRATPEQLARLEAARAVVAAGPEGVDQEGAVAPLPPELEEHAARLKEVAGHLFEAGWQPALVDLTRLYAVQGVVLTDDVDQRLAGVALDKLANLAELTLPTQPTSNYQTLLDLERKVWVLSSRDPNLQVTTSFAGPVPGAPPSAPVYGFHVAMQRSVVQAVRYQGRWYLRDGYQRSIGLLGSGVRRVPGLVREFADLEGWLPRTQLRQTAFLGPRPPLVPSYLDDRVAADVLAPASRKMVMVQAVELRLHD